MSDRTIPKPDINSWLEDEMYTQFLHDRKGVDEDWKDVFETTGAPVAATTNGVANGHAPAPVAPPPAAIAVTPAAAPVPAESVPAPPATKLLTAPAIQLGP